ncbi:MAG: hypothetical protein GY866_17210 [Proteobacteria bacterium]|nr:hypothetical protein [Pseudomonadota bacterium]
MPNKEISKTMAAACVLEICEGCRIEGKLLCNRCFNLSCPVNRVPEEVKESFFKNYPAFAEAWNRDGGAGRANRDSSI